MIRDTEIQTQFPHVVKYPSGALTRMKHDKNIIKALQL
jgi:hypothetical protein